jgi:hypothetical protein
MPQSLLMPSNEAVEKVLKRAILKARESTPDFPHHHEHHRSHA